MKLSEKMDKTAGPASYWVDDVRQLEEELETLKGAVMMDYGDKASIEIIRKELSEIESWLLHAANATTDDYGEACDRAIELRRKLGITKEKP